MRNNKNSNIEGVGVALVTPFDERGEVEYDKLEGLVDYVIENGVDYLVALGTTAETPTLTDDEILEIVACVKRRNGGRVPLVLGVGGYNTAELIRRIEGKDFSEVSALLSVTPYYNRPTDEGLFQHYKRVAEASPVPIILYNVPARTGVNMGAEITLRIAREIDNVLGVKEASGNIAQCMEILNGRPEGFKVISGDDLTTIPLMSVGGDGVISVAANAFPKAFTQMMDAALEHNTKETIANFHRLYRAMRIIFEEGNPTGVKSALSIKGMMSDMVRLPLVRATDGLREKLERTIKENEL